MAIVIINSNYYYYRAIDCTGRHGSSVVIVSELGPEGREFEPWPVDPRCVLTQNT